ncbi:translin-associated protein X [Drechmeria coniospora]|uniref:Translin-associated protein X n=1 Tax=Drechmeria coniospora TaxID=98403 RepID=A0A151GKF5_DRECN|nr:translin-associated protein X [Drechmeria coniospora]KYK57576.1 translin-associated protein X [Drechmeria coniospora]ODA79466.1 hypothetical protein RJ55_05059 [Drechmeria coniospora]
MSGGGVKRDRDGRMKKALAPDAPRGRFHTMFEHFRDELDEHYDRRERIVKTSRDVTAQSKKMVKTLNQDVPPHIQKDIDARMADITRLLAAVAPDLQSLNRHRYTWPMRCLEELVEALSFAYYLQHQRLITLEQAQASVPVDIRLTAHDYMFGVFDLFGEMMRFATVQRALVVGDSQNRTILRDIQELACAFEMLPNVPTKDYRNKMETMRQSVRKVENLGYGLVVRGSERPSGWVPDMQDQGPEPVSPV